MKALTQNLINGLKQEAVKVQDYEFASAVRSLERNDGGLSEKDQELELYKMIDEFNSKHDNSKPNRIGETLVVDDDIAITANGIRDQANNLRYEAEGILERAAVLQNGMWELFSKKYPEFCEEKNKRGISYNNETKVLTIIK